MVSIGEFALIDKIKKRFKPLDLSVIGIGDDAAVIKKSKNKEMFVTTDTLVEGVHFLPDKTKYTHLGYKAVAVNISDIAAMGGIPSYALLTLGISDKTKDSEIDELIEGMLFIRKKCPYDLIGGDTVHSRTFFITIAMIGFSEKKPLLRSSAKKGDYIYLTGSSGDSGIGLSIIKNTLKYPVKNHDYFIQKHFLPEIRVNLMQYLRKHYKLGAVIDVSDGVLSDLIHIAEESRTGFKIDIDKLPVSSDKIGDSFYKNEYYFYELALGSGEDYEILFTSPDQLKIKKTFQDTGAELTCIGRIEPENMEAYYKGNKLDISSLKKGYTHF
jgi:thiamine-monophosphate kinase